jgi:hypothetical protein
VKQSETAGEGASSSANATEDKLLAPVLVKVINSGRRGSNPRHSAWEADTLPTELRPRVARTLPLLENRLKPSAVVIRNTVAAVVDAKLNNASAGNRKVH